MDIIKPTIQCFNKLKIEYVLCGPGLSGLINHSNIKKYSNSYTIFIINHQPIKMMGVFFILLLKKIILKIKIKTEFDNGQKFLHFSYKIVGKPTLLSKTSNKIRVKILKKTKKQFKIWIGGQFVFYEIEDLIHNEFVNYNNMKISVPCNPQKFTKKYKNNIFAGMNKNYNVRLKDKKEKEAMDLLDKVATVLEKEESKYFLDAGTLLGAVRDKKFIPWDHDIDLGLVYFNQEKVDKLIIELKKHFYVRALKFKKDPTIWSPGEYRIIKVYKKRNKFFYRQSSKNRKNEICLDIFIFYKSTLDNTNKSVYKYGVWNRNAFYPENVLKEFKLIKFYNRLYMAPKNPEIFLEFKYGENWKIPQKKWSTILEDTSLVRNNSEKGN